MVKWADYGISKVRYNAEHTHIVKVEVRADQGDTLGNPVEWARSQVVSELKRGTTFITIILNAEGKYKRGQDVHTVTINGTEYIRTDQNRKAADNLENLPEF